MTDPASAWVLYADHRAHFTNALLGSASAAGGKLCLLGAGHCNDVDLERLCQVFSEIHLVDIDAQAVQEAVSRQTVEVRSRLRRHAPMDLSGFSKHLEKWSRLAPALAEIEAASASALRALVPRLGGPFDVVASACLLTQMSFELRDALGGNHPMMHPIRLALMATHLRTLVGITRAGGTSLFACDLVSSNYHPLDQLSPDKNLYDVMNEILDAGTYYFAANPTLIQAILKNDAALSISAGEPDLLDPWLWTGLLDRTYFVYALRWKRTGSPSATITASPHSRRGPSAATRGRHRAR